MRQLSARVDASNARLAAAQRELESLRKQAPTAGSAPGRERGVAAPPICRRPCPRPVGAQGRPRAPAFGAVALRGAVATLRRLPAIAGGQRRSSRSCAFCSAPYRRFHNLEHIHDCLRRVDDVAQLLDRSRRRRARALVSRCGLRHGFGDQRAAQRGALRKARRGRGSGFRHRVCGADHGDAAPGRGAQSNDRRSSSTSISRVSARRGRSSCANGARLREESSSKTDAQYHGGQIWLPRAPAAAAPLLRHRVLSRPVRSERRGKTCGGCSPTSRARVTRPRRGRSASASSGRGAAPRRAARTRSSRTRRARASAPTR